MRAVSLRPTCGEGCKELGFEPAAAIMAHVLNVNNEVVKLRKEVKRARVLTIRRLTRHIGKLKLKKGSEDVVLKNQRRAQRLIEEIHAMKEIKPDQVTKFALEKEINFESVCKMPNCTTVDRAIARLAAHPLLKTKIADIKAAVKAFKAARQTAAKAHSSAECKSEQPKLVKHSNSNREDKHFELVQKQKEDGSKTKVNVKTDTNTQGKETGENKSNQETLEAERTCTPDDLPFPALEMQAIVQAETEKRIDRPQKKKLTGVNKVITTKESDSNVSDTEENDKHKEYFDDSTEERFYNQSSDSEDNDSSDDFFIGKVKQKKRRRVADSNHSSAKKIPPKMLLKAVKDSEFVTRKDVNTEGNNPNAKTKKLESVFCTSLSTSQQKSKNMRRNVKEQLPKNRRTAFPKKEPEFRKHQPAKAAGIKHENKKDHLQQPLHPSWEASKKRQQQVSQITAFQGKKIKFDDD
ncbi:PREDICTED: serum response factor-binding protein 1 isoform X1 [Crocodylus porosus]|uniref:Serum response factor-binding protein 1 n=1 Tax=Crocodylus porosus TaxID=8502 RepID=A0A7M4EYU2_CROPO|nr:PREDICTED: serum response factor-binding protein 1 isoform X1 [Crocodylus porosus]